MCYPSWLENECKELDQYDRTGKARQLFEKVRKVKKTPLKTKQACINDAQGNIITEQSPLWKDGGNTMSNCLRNL